MKTLAGEVAYFLSYYSEMAHLTFTALHNQMLVSKSTGEWHTLPYANLCMEI